MLHELLSNEEIGVESTKKAYKEAKENLVDWIDAEIESRESVEGAERKNKEEEDGERLGTKDGDSVLVENVEEDDEGPKRDVTCEGWRIAVFSINQANLLNLGIVEERFRLHVDQLTTHD